MTNALGSHLYNSRLMWGKLRAADGVEGEPLFFMRDQLAMLHGYTTRKGSEDLLLFRRGGRSASRRRCENCCSRRSASIAASRTKRWSASRNTAPVPTPKSSRARRGRAGIAGATRREDLGMKRRPRLTAIEKERLLDAYQADEPTRAIAERFNVDPSYPSILAGRCGVKRRFSDHHRAAISVAKSSRRVQK